MTEKRSSIQILIAVKLRGRTLQRESYCVPNPGIRATAGVVLGALRKARRREKRTAHAGQGRSSYSDRGATRAVSGRSEPVCGPDHETHPRQEGYRSEPGRAVKAVETAWVCTKLRKRTRRPPNSISAMPMASVPCEDIHREGKR